MSTTLDEMKSDLNVAMKQQLSEDAHTAEEAKVTMAAIRGGMKAVSDAETKGKNRKVLSEAEVFDVLRNLNNDMLEAAKIYRGAGAEDRAVAEEKEAAVLSKYYPKQADEKETRDAVEAFIDAESLRGTGMRSMGVVKAHFNKDDHFNNKTVSMVALELLSE